MVLERELDALLADVVGAGEAEHVRHHLAAGVVAAVFAVLEQARDVQLAHALGDLRRNLALEVDEIASRLVQALVDFLRRHLQQRGELGTLLRFENCTSSGIAQTDFTGVTDRERLAVAVGDPAAVGADLEHAAVARLALLLQEIVVQPCR